MHKEKNRSANIIIGRISPGNKILWCSEKGISYVLYGSKYENPRTFSVLPKYECCVGNSLSNNCDWPDCEPSCIYSSKSLSEDVSPSSVSSVSFSSFKCWG